MRTLKNVSNADELDMRPAVGLAGDESEKARKFVFYPAGSKVNPREAERQAREGVEMTDDQALAILTSPHGIGGWVDMTKPASPTLDGTPVEPKDVGVETAAKKSGK
jgi:hypothetical protein